MGFLDFFFKKKEKEEPVEIIPELIDTEHLQMDGSGMTCDYCESAIYADEPRKKLSGKAYHRKCFKKMKKEASKQLFG